MRRRDKPWGRGRGAPLGWVLARGIHRTVVGFLLMGVTLGVLGGVVVHSAVAAGHWSVGTLCLAFGLVAAVWPLSWMATVRIAWPLRELARFAHELRGGDLRRRDRPPAGPPEVGEVGDALRGMADRVARQLRDQRSLLAAVSHELRSPLGRARVLVEMAREGSAAANVYDELQGEIDAMDHLVGDLLAAARIDFEAVNPRALDAVDLARRALELAGMDPARLSVEGAPVDVLADPTLLARALRGLLDNAERYGGPNVTFHVRARLTRVRFEVEDDGPGFPDGDVERAFQPFWRGAGRVAPGEGLGLALVRQIAQAHGGEAGAENRVGGGARVWVELPIGAAAR